MRWIIRQWKEHIALELVHIQKTGNTGDCGNINKRALGANNSAAKIIGGVTLLLQLQTRLPEFEQEFL